MANIRNALPKPTHCDNCCSLNIELTTNDKVYGRTYGDWPKIWFCNDCKASVGCHPNTDIPLGKMADRKIRQLRAKAHTHFDKLWQFGLFSRDRAYYWLAANLEIPFDECHISWLSEEQLNRTIEISREYLEANSNGIEKRKAKKHEKRRNQQKRENRQVANHVRRRKAKR